MSLSEHLAQRRGALVGAWFDRIVERYPRETASFLKRQEDPFANPVGATLREELAPLVDGLLAGGEVDSVASSLDRILRVRAVQEMPPSDAVAFVLDLKDLVRAQIGTVPGEHAAELAEVDARIDRLLLLAFDVYARCRQEVYEIRVRAIHNRSLKVMERLNAWRDGRQGEEGGAAAPDSRVGG